MAEMEARGSEVLLLIPHRMGGHVVPMPYAVKKCLASCYGSRVSTVLVYLDLEKGFPLHLFSKEFQDKGIGTAREVSYKNSEEVRVVPYEACSP